MQCQCNPKYIYKTHKSFQSHLSTKRHKDWTETPHLVIAKRSQRNVSEVTKKEIAARSRWRCEICQDILTANYEIDHKLALYLGGTNAKDNLQSLCLECHRTKTREEYDDYQVAKQAYEAYMR
tara:strand:- start:2072 stop:2440 length:369 start_codon:yes stop_codon:yes gene_type:complete